MRRLAKGARVWLAPGRQCEARLLFVAVFLLAFSRAAPAQTSPKVTIAYAAVSPIFAGVWMAKEMGAFEKHGVKADLIYISSGSVTVQAMVGGNLDMSVAASNAVVSSILRGAPLVAVGSITNRPAMSLFVQPEITKPEQLQGKVLGITRHGSSTHFLTQFVIEKLGLQDKVKIQPMGGTREVDTAIRTGMIAGAVRSMKPGPKVRVGNCAGDGKVHLAESLRDSLAHFHREPAAVV
jgi:NitT/TauT family transport system substrate-binding protein